MKNMPSRFRSFAISMATCSLCLAIAGCDLIAPAGDPQYDEVVVTLRGILPSPPTSMYQVDQMSLFNQTSCQDSPPSEEYDLVWDGKAFSADYVLNCQSDGVVIVYTVHISGKLSSNHRKLETFTGTRKWTYTSSNLVEYHEYVLAIKDFPLEGDEDILSGSVESNLGSHIVNASWVWNSTDNEGTINRQGTVENLANPRMEMSVLFNTRKY